ncbi:hypothetical protein JYU34_015722 [Plutella xylostella]|uniref:Uncharacterized protein n=1 Tax=Plutella xylostella TaxID=51655 RepID=A0ABQ7Q8B5_PLUXY|nr:hypothetical protein JYU34_015722 [Plutella xylostella]
MKLVLCLLVLVAAAAGSRGNVEAASLNHEIESQEDYMPLSRVAREEPPPPPPEMTPPPEEMPPPPPQDKKMPSLVSRHKRSPKGGGTMPTRKG